MVSAMQLREGHIQEDTRRVVERRCDGKQDSLPMSESPTRNDHRMAQSKSSGLRRQSRRLSGAGSTRPTRDPYQAQDFLRKEENGQLCVNNRVLKQAPRRGPTFESVSGTQPVEAYAKAYGPVSGGILMQNGHPVTAESQKQSAAEGSYTMFGKGMLTTIRSLKDGRQHSQGSTHGRETNNIATNRFDTRPKWALSQEKWQRDVSRESLQKNSVIEVDVSLAETSQVEEKNGVQLWKLTQSYVNAAMSSSMDGNQFVGVCGGHSVQSRLVGPSYVGKNPQACNSTKRWKLESDIVRTDREEASKWPEKWADKKHRLRDSRGGDQVIVKRRSELTQFLKKTSRSLPRERTRGTNRSSRSPC